MLSQILFEFLFFDLRSHLLSVLLRDRLRTGIGGVTIKRIRVILEPVIRFMLFIKVTPQIESEVIL
ncbi:hypothetical protein BCT16_21645 [Vibrio sp. 10N.222.54.B6]|jgi:hypothetical protein|nr:hypothetical protein A134_22295 [Vibrio crassostreae 9CS106]PMK26263.1 hypothetical protein BCU05_21840 [Vibrio sp. 10N.261.54.C3]PMO09095.1 hypothetical protein BCT20_21830 [Vibrio sp. 10N.222.55.C12]PMO24768.1 hypothetical protein BCT16_21645 [Vibrio sp. 10N.222.54.B6]